ncbi:molybdenum cofactor guanylyltransferase [Pandoraea terrae]|uniref:Molybdenum cofactor guanylyltransferase n=1 Tax=Pandoraea terrae TaxID=1537710 RepID=A0A5E4TUR9_9BURK|nr:molybdenum cofactor guanylyltransferase MobA [Pandoraea terrae]VVD91635.1 molybdenum cofactor guanylyltransferase [Pandoraea terrae]
MTASDAVAAAPDRSQVTGVILAGGRGQRMGGLDKGLQPLHGAPLAAHVMQRLQPQVGALLISANRHADRYAALGAPVVGDHAGGFPGPLAGMLAGLEAANTPFVITVPCDSPFLPGDLVARLGAALMLGHADAAFAITDSGPHPVFALLRTSLAGSLAQALARDERRVQAWLARHKAVQVHFPDERPFYNINTLEDLHAYERRGPAA